MEAEAAVSAKVNLHGCYAIVAVQCQRGKHNVGLQFVDERAGLVCSVWKTLLHEGI